METLAIRLRKAMEEQNIKQIELTEKTGIPKSAISQYLSGKFVPKQDRLTVLAVALNVNEAWPTSLFLISLNSVKLKFLLFNCSHKPI